MKKIQTVFLAISILLSSVAFSQRGHGQGHGRHGQARHHHPKKVVVVKRSAYRPKHVRAFHPHWHPGRAYNRRWVFFPGYNLYWDNWRNHYVFWNGVVWVSQPKAPPVVVNVNLEKEKHVELKEEEDDVDDVYKSNDSHKQEAKPE
jgi:hypothetical protein